MSFAGDYRLASMKKLKSDDSGFEDVAIEVILAEKEKDEPDNSIDNIYRTIITITEEGEMIYHMPIPEGVPEDQIEAAKAKGFVVNGEFVVDRKMLKMEDGNIYMQDTSKFLTGDEWVKINTENEGELNLVLMKYKKI